MNYEGKIGVLLYSCNNGESHVVSTYAQVIILAMTNNFSFKSIFQFLVSHSSKTPFVAKPENIHQSWNCVEYEFEALSHGNAYGAILHTKECIDHCRNHLQICSIGGADIGKNKYDPSPFQYGDAIDSNNRCLQVHLFEETKNAFSMKTIHSQCPIADIQAVDCVKILITQ